MNDIDRAKYMLPNMPVEVFDAWLLPIIRDHGTWPYPNKLSPHPSEQWHRYFGLYTLNDISSLFWDKFDLTFARGLLDQLSGNTIKVLIENHVLGIDTTGHFNVRGSRERFFGFIECIQQSGTIPPPIIGVNTPNGLRILDGNHRLAALTYLRLSGRIICDTWVGHPAANEQ